MDNFLSYYIFVEKIASSKITENNQPSNLEAEQALLGSILVNNDVIDEISSIVNSTTFYDPAHIKIYEVIENLNNKAWSQILLHLKIFLKKDNMLNEVGGTEYLVKLTRFSGSNKTSIWLCKNNTWNVPKRELVQFLINCHLIL